MVLGVRDAIKRRAAPASGIAQKLYNQFGGSKAALRSKGPAYSDPVPPQHRKVLDEAFAPNPTNPEGESGYTVTPHGGDWMNQPGPFIVHRMYAKNGEGGDAFSQRNTLRATKDFGATHAEETEGNVVNAGPNDPNGWEPPAMASFRTAHTGHQVETTPQTTLVGQFHPEAAESMARIIHNRYRMEGSNPVKGSWMYPDTSIMGDLPNPPSHMKEVTMNWRDTPAGRQLTYTRGRALPGWNQRKGYVHESLHDDILKSQKRLSFVHKRF